MKVAFYTLGCKVNQYETQALKEDFARRGFSIGDELGEADIYVINTCTVTNLADRKSRQYIRKMKKQNPESIIAVIGCYAQVSPHEAAAIAGVDLVLGNNEKTSLPEYVETLLSGRHQQSHEGGHKDNHEDNHEGRCENSHDVSHENSHGSIHECNHEGSHVGNHVNIYERNCEDSHENGHEDGYEDSHEDSQGDRLKGNQTKSPFVRILKREDLSEYEESGMITSMESRTRAYIKIQDGCDQFCSYCIIPYARGPIRSRPAREIIKEAESLIEKGFKELILTGINTALYGREAGFSEDCDEVYGIEVIVKLINDLPGDFRIRLGSLEPTVIDASLAERLLKYPRLCHHMHLSLQSGSDRILKAMNRHYDREEYLDIVKALRKADPHYGLTTDVIAGFPGETEEDFSQSKDLIGQVGFVKTHVFPYSKRQGTKAAGMADQIDGTTKKARSSALAGIAEESAKNFLKGTMGTVRKVLFEEYEPARGLISGYSGNFVRVYCEVGDESRAESLINTLQNIKFTELYLDGVKGELA